MAGVRKLVAGDDIELVDDSVLQQLRVRVKDGRFMRIADLAELAGASTVGFSFGQPYESDTSGWGIRTAGGTINVLRHIDPSLWAGILDGTGTADLTAAIQAALAALQSGGSLYFPAGLYLADTGCLRVNGKSRIAIFGDGAATVIRQSGQGASGSRVTWHSTMMLDQCSEVTVQDMVVEAKGSQYGDIPNTKPSTPALCADAVANEFGVALAITRCTGTVTLRNITGRYAGDNSVFYFSSCERVVARDCFANAASLAYAGFNADNWCDSSLGGRRYEFYNNRVQAESTVPAGLSTSFSGKAGMVLEGDNTKPLECVVQGGFIRETGIASGAETYGAAVVATDCHLTMNGVKVRGCYGGARLNKRGGVTDELIMNVQSNDFRGCKVYGVYLAIGSSSGYSTFSVRSNLIEVEQSSVWSALTGTAVEYSTGIVHDGFMSGSAEITDNTIIGPQYGVWSLDQAQFTIKKNRIIASARGVNIEGAGTNTIDQNDIETTGVGSVPIYITTLNHAASASRNSYLYANGNTLRPAGDTTSDYAMQLTGNSALFVETQAKGNNCKRGLMSIAKGSASLYDVDPILLQVTQRVVANGLTGSDTYVELQLPKEYLPAYSYAVGSDGVSRAVIGQTNNSSGTRGRVRVILSGDVRSNYSAASNARVTFMQ